MNYKTTAVLALLVIIIGVVWMLYPGDDQRDVAKPVPEEITATEATVLDPSPAPETIVGVTIARPDKPKLVFAREPQEGEAARMGSWRAVEPLTVPVMPLDSLLYSLTGMTSSKQFEPGAAGAPSEADVGLNPPRVTVTLRDKEGKDYTLEIGAKAAVGDDTYMRVGGKKTVHVVNADLFAGLRKDFNDYRDKKLVTLKAVDAVRVEITTPSESCIFSRSADSPNWVIDAPVQAYALRDQVLELVRSIGNLRATDFAEDAPADLAPYELDQPTLTASVTTETRRPVPTTQEGPTTEPAEPQYEVERQSVTVLIGGYADLERTTRYAKLADQPWVVKLQQKDVEGLLPDLNKLRDPQITRVKAANATRLELTVAGESATLWKEGATWRGEGALADLELPAVQDVLEAFEDLSAMNFLSSPDPLSRYGLAEPRAVIAVTTSGAVSPVRVLVGDASGSGLNTYVMRDDQPTVFVVSTAQVRRLMVTPLSLRSRKIFTASERDVQRITLQRGKQHYELSRTGDTWTFQQPAGAPIDVLSVRVLVGDLSRLRARRVVAARDDGRYGLDEPAVTVHFTVAEAPPAESQPTSAPTTQPVEHVLRVARQVEAVYAQFDDVPYVFELDETVYKVLAGELIRREVFSFAPEDVVGLTVAAPGGTLELAQEDGQWQFTPDPFVKLAQPKVKELIAGVAGMRVELFLEYENADLAAAGLLNAPVTVSIRLRDGTLHNLKIEPEQPGALPRVAGLVEARRTFLLQRAFCEELLRGLDAYLQTDGAQQPPMAPLPPG
ncbi:MAG: DUF4340 domain-containing protein [Phycisphaerae bacterium]|jgi:hypothetical protein